MLKKFKYKDITWIDLESPTQEELAEIGAEYQIHPVAINELAKPSLRTKVDLYDGYIYLILHFPFTAAGGGDPNPDDDQDQQEVDFIVGKEFIITAHYSSINPLNDFAKIFEMDFGLKKGTEKIHAGFVFFYILREMYASLDEGLRFINDQMKKAEKKVFSGREREMVETLAVINRELIDCRWSLKSHKEVLASLEIAGLEIFGAKFAYYLKAISGEQEKLWNMLENLRENFSDLADTNDSLLAIKTNNIMRVLTVAAFIFLPMTVIPQVFGMNIEVMPFITHPSGFWIVLFLMIVSSALLYLISRLKKWF